MPKGSEKVDMKILPHGKMELPANQCRPICQPWADWLAMVSWYSYFPCGRIFISSFSQLFGINIEGLNSLFLGIKLFI